MFLPSFKFAH